MALRQRETRACMPSLYLLLRGFAITLIGHITSGRVISSTQGPLPDNTQQPKETNIHSAGGIRNHNPSKLAAADPRFRFRGHWDRPFVCKSTDYFIFLRLMSSG
jgi:hypothetical protein